MAVGADHGATAGLLSQADSHVKELEELEDYYFEADRQAKMTAVANKVVDSVDRSLVTLRPLPQDLNARGLFLKGRALSFLPGRDAKAEELLSKALKLDPKLLAAWNALGEVHWNTQNYHRSRECFEHALEFCGDNSISLRGLSMVLRAVETDGAAKVDDSVRQANFQKALEKAKAAIALDAGDAQNWENLGNAYVGDFFVNARRPDELSRALIAYGKAEAIYGKLGKANPSLQLNRGMAAKYLEDYDLALRSFRKAQEIGSPNAAKEEQKVVELVQKLAGYAQRKGDLKSKHLKELLDDMKQVAEGQRSLRDLRANTGSADVPLVAKVVNIVDRLQDLPMIITCSDAHGDFLRALPVQCRPSKGCRLRGAHEEYYPHKAAEVSRGVYRCQPQNMELPMRSRGERRRRICCRGQFAGNCCSAVEVQRGGTPTRAPTRSFGRPDTVRPFRLAPILSVRDGN